MSSDISLALDALEAGVRFCEGEGRIPNSLKKACIERADAIEECGVEVDDGEKSYWIYLRAGFTNTYLECPTIHERRAYDAIVQIHSFIGRVSPVGDIIAANRQEETNS